MSTSVNLNRAVNTNHANQVDVAIIGAGPVGTMTACLLKAVNPDLNIAVFDKRPKGGRKHALVIEASSMKAVTNLLEKTLKNKDPHFDKTNAKILQRELRKWRRVKATNEIEDDLAAVAVRIGVSVSRDKANAFGKSIAPTSPMGQALSSARVIIGADGAASQVRQVNGVEKIQEETFEYMVELKLPVPDLVKPRKLLDASADTSMYRELDFETMPRSRGLQTKPATRHVLSDRQTFEALTSAHDHTKGLHANPWRLEELKKSPDKNIRKLAARLDRRIINFAKGIKNKEDRQAAIDKMRTEAAITRLPLTVFKSEKAVLKVADKIVMFVGDALSGAVLARGMNKGLIESVYCVQSIDQFFKEDKKGLEKSQEELPKSFQKYAKQTGSLFNKERRVAKIKAGALDVAQFFIKLITLPYVGVKKTVKGIKNRIVGIPSQPKPKVDLLPSQVQALNDEKILSMLNKGEFTASEMGYLLPEQIERIDLSKIIDRNVLSQMIMGGFRNKVHLFRNANLDILLNNNFVKYDNINAFDVFQIKQCIKCGYGCSVDDSVDVTQKYIQGVFKAHISKFSLEDVNECLEFDLQPFFKEVLEERKRSIELQMSQ